MGYIETKLGDSLLADKTRLIVIWDILKHLINKQLIMLQLRLIVIWDILKRNLVIVY